MSRPKTTRRLKVSRRKNPEPMDIFSEAKKNIFETYDEIDREDRWFEEDPVPGSKINIRGNTVSEIEEEVEVQTSRGPVKRKIVRPLGWKELFGQEVLQRNLTKKPLDDLYEWMHTTGRFTDEEKYYKKNFIKDPNVQEYLRNVTVNSVSPINNLRGTDFPPERSLVDLAVDQAENFYEELIRELMNKYPVLVEEDEVEAMVEESLDPELLEQARRRWKMREAEMEGYVYSEDDEEELFDDEQFVSELNLRGVFDLGDERARRKLAAMIEDEVLESEVETPRLLKMTDEEMEMEKLRREAMLEEALAEMPRSDFRKRYAEMMGETTDESSIQAARFRSMVESNIATGASAPMAVIDALREMTEGEKSEREDIEDLMRQQERLREFAERYIAMYGRDGGGLSRSERELRDAGEFFENPRKRRGRKKNAELVDELDAKAAAITLMINIKIGEGDLNVNLFMLEDLGLDASYRDGAKLLIEEKFLREVGRFDGGRVYYALTPETKELMIQAGVMPKYYGEGAQPRKDKIFLVPDDNPKKKSKKTGKKKAAKKAPKKSAKKAAKTTSDAPKKRGRPPKK